MFISTTSQPAWAFSLRQSQTGQALIWSKTNLDVGIDTGKIPEVGGAEDAVRAAFAMWLSSGVPLDVAFHPNMEAGLGSGDGRDSVIWQTTEWPYDEEVVAMTVALYNKDTALVSETDILLNARDYQWTTSPEAHPDRYDVQNVVTHEAGHFFGLGHEEQVREATMFPTTPPGEIEKRSLTSDDLAGIAAIIQEMDQRGVEHSAATEGPSIPTEELVRSEELQRNGPLPSRGAVGCSTGGAGASGSWLVLAALLGLAAVRRRPGARSGRRIRVLLLGVAALVPVTAGATVVRSLSVEELSHRAPIVVQAQVVSQKSVAAAGVIFTDYTLAVERCLRGDCGQRLVLRTLGGEVGHRGMFVEGMPRLRAGQHLVLFARPRGARVTALGMAQGVFHLAGKVAHRDLRGLSLLGREGTVQGDEERISLDALLEAISRSWKPAP